MSTPQAGIFATDGNHHQYLEARVAEGCDLAALRGALARALHAEDPASDREDQYVVVGFGNQLWRQLAPACAPREMRDFQALEGGNHQAPATQGDIWIWIHGPRLDENLARMLAVWQKLGEHAELLVDEQGFRFRDSRDLTGFIDGSANPKGDAARQAALVPEGETGAGGSFVLTQRWIHDLTRFQALPVDEQERVIGRTRAESIELTGDAMPADSHVSRTDVAEEGVALKVFRRSAPYGRVGEHGLYFLSFACELHRHQVMLDRMFGISGDGIYDRVIDFTRPVTGSYYFAPSLADLEGALGE